MASKLIHHTACVNYRLYGVNSVMTRVSPIPKPINTENRKFIQYLANRKCFRSSAARSQFTSGAWVCFLS